MNNSWDSDACSIRPLSLVTNEAIMSCGIKKFAT